MKQTQPMIDRLAALVDRLRPSAADDIAGAERNVRAETVHLAQQPEVAAQLADDLRTMLALPHQTPFYAETGVRSALGFSLELLQRLSQRLLPPPPDRNQLQDVIGMVFRRSGDYQWVTEVSDEAWVALAAALGLAGARDREGEPAMANVLVAIRVLSYRLTGTALDRELLHADPALERYESPFLAQNAALIPLLERVRTGGPRPTLEEVRDIDVLLDQCVEVLERMRRKAGENGISIRLTYLLARLRQLIARLRVLLDFTAAEDRLRHAVGLMKTLLAAEQTRHQVGHYLGENVSLVARNITDHASRHGEHYIAEDRAEWWAMARSAAGGGVIIAMMAMIKIQLALLHLPPLTEGIAFGLNYGIGFVLIHLLGFTVATKQPAMTAAAIAATLEESRPRDLEKLGDLAQSVVRTQFIAVLGNVGLALPVACLIALAWPLLFGHPAAPTAKVEHMMQELHPLRSGALFFAAVAGVGLFLSGLVSGYYDNQARYRQLAARIAATPSVARLGRERAAKFSAYIDAHYGAILGNLFFGMYLGLVGVLGNLTGLPVDIRHVAFASANVGTALTMLDVSAMAGLFAWAVAGVVGIALVNLAVSFSLALYVAMKSRRLGTGQILRLGVLMLQRFMKNPFGFFALPEKR